jgi:hypothetical protein
MEAMACGIPVVGSDSADPHVVDERGMIARGGPLATRAPGARGDPSPRDLARGAGRVLGASPLVLSSGLVCAVPAALIRQADPDATICDGQCRVRSLSQGLVLPLERARAERCHAWAGGGAGATSRRFVAVDFRARFRSTAAVGEGGVNAAASGRRGATPHSPRDVGAAQLVHRHRPPPGATGACDHSARTSGQRGALSALSAPMQEGARRVAS